MNVDDFLSQYEEPVFSNAMKIRELVLACLPNIIEQIDFSARMIAYSYGQKYSEMICTIYLLRKN